MEKNIRNKLAAVEREHNVHILFAVESGSRAWGFASPDSDYDIRFVYRRDKTLYLSLWESKDTITFMTEDDLDGSGWDLRKALRLLAKSNASFASWLFSPVVYLDRDGVMHEMRKLAAENFNPVSGFYHYFSMNKGFNELLGSEDMTLKSYFYAIRTALCANWIAKHETIPPVDFRGLYALLSSGDCALLDALIETKSHANEKSREEVPARLIALAEEVMRENNAMKDNMSNRKADPEAFDRFFLKQLT